MKSYSYAYPIMLPKCYFLLVLTLLVNAVHLREERDVGTAIQYSPIGQNGRDVPDIASRQDAEDENRLCIGWRCQPDRTHKYDNENGKIRAAPRIKVRLLHNYNSMFYTKWSQWSNCSRNCQTSRYRSCRYTLFCGTAVLREEDYCHAQSSSCDNLVYQKNKQGSNYNRQAIDKHELSNKNNSIFYSRPNYLNFSLQENPPGQMKQEEIIINSKYNIENFHISSEENLHISNVSVGGQSSSIFLSPMGHINKNNKIHFKNDILPHDEQKFTSNSMNIDIISKLEIRERRIGYSKGTSINRGIEARKSKHDMKVFTSDRKINPKRGDALRYFLYPTLGRRESLPQNCGKNNVKKSLLSLKILGGTEPAPHKWPWQVAILNRAKEVFCGGTLIASQWVMTAAHCLRKRLYVRLGEHDLTVKEDQEIQFKITETIEHPLYDSTTVDNDVALLRLPQTVKVGITMAPVCLPAQGSSLPVGKQCTIIGWGKERHSHFVGTEVLNEAQIPIIDEDLCRRVYANYYITQNMFCAGHRKGRIDSCAGDSGGPLLCQRHGRWYIYGITSFGEGCGRKGKFGIYARVSNYRLWVNDVIAAHSHRYKYASRRRSKKKRRRYAKHRYYQRRRHRKAKQ